MHLQMMKITVVISIVYLFMEILKKCIMKKKPQQTKNKNNLFIINYTERNIHTSVFPSVSISLSISTAWLFLI